MKYRDDIDIENTWVVSDTHFGHENIVGFCHRPEDHEQVMIAEWRKAVPDDATVLHLGDLCYKGNARFKNLTAKELTGERKLLVMGNHDRQRFSFYKACGFQIVKPFALQVEAGPNMSDGVRVGIFNPNRRADAPGWGASRWWNVSFSHYPWSDEEEGRKLVTVSSEVKDLRIHGHIHNNGYSRDAFVPFVKGHINVSVEQTKYTPVNLKLLLDAALLGDFPETTEAQLQEARDRKAGIR